VVMDKGRMVGILTFRRSHGPREGPGSFGETKVGEIMEHDP